MRRVRAVVCLVSLAVGLDAGAARGDTAEHVIALNFSGYLRVNPWMSYSVLGPQSTGTWNVSGWGSALSGGDSVPSGAWIDVSGDLHAGVVRPFGDGATCDLSGGSNGRGAVELSFGSLPPHTMIHLADVSWAQSAAMTTVFTGDTLDRDGNVTGEILGVFRFVIRDFEPAVGGEGRCITGTASAFVLYGAASLTYAG